MAITVVPGSAQLPVTKRPVLTIAKDDSSTNMTFTCSERIGDKMAFFAGSTSHGDEGPVQDHRQVPETTRPAGPWE